MSRADAFIRLVTSSKLYRPDGTVETTKSPAVWTLAHRGYSGGGRLDIWVYRTKAAALYAGADLAMEAGLEEDPKARVLFAAGRYGKLMELYEQSHPRHSRAVRATRVPPVRGRVGADHTPLQLTAKAWSVVAVGDRA